MSITQDRICFEIELEGKSPTPAEYPDKSRPNQRHRYRSGGVKWSLRDKRQHCSTADRKMALQHKNDQKKNTEKRFLYDFEQILVRLLLKEYYL